MANVVDTTSRSHDRSANTVIVTSASSSAKTTATGENPSPAVTIDDEATGSGPREGSCAPATVGHTIPANANTVSQTARYPSDGRQRLAVVEHLLTMHPFVAFNRLGAGPRRPCPRRRPPKRPTARRYADAQRAHGHQEYKSLRGLGADAVHYPAPPAHPGCSSGRMYIRASAHSHESTTDHSHKWVPRWR